MTEASVDLVADDATLPSAAPPDRRGQRLLSRIVWLLVVVWAAVTVTFILSRIVPADPARLAAGMQAGPEQVAEVRHQLGLDRPLPEQYVEYVTGLARGDFGDSVQTCRPVLDDLGTYLPATLELVVYSFILFAITGVSLGVIWAVWPRGVHSWLIRVGSVIGAAVPVFWVGLVFQLVFGSRLGWFPIAGNLEYSRFDVPKHTGAGTLDALLALDPAAFANATWHLVLPVLTIVVTQLALTTRLTRASLSEQLTRPYVRTARARGVGERRVVLVDVLRNAANPVITMLGLQFGWLLGSTILIEVMFSWPGLGSYAFNAFRTFDYNPIMAITIVITVAFVLVNELVNVLYPRLDPRLPRAAMTAVVGELEAAPVVDTEPAPPRRKRDRGLRIWIALTVVATAFLVLFPGVIAPGSPTAITASDRLQPPSTEHLFGTDEAGRDLFTRIVHGARPSLGSALIVVATAATIGTLFGAAAGWRGGRLDRFAMRLVDVFLSFPYLVLAMAVASSMERGMRAAIIALVIVWWPGYARLVRGMVLSLKSDLHVKAARTLGAGQVHVLRWHVIPHLRGPLLTRATLDVGFVLLAIAGLSFLGLAAQNPSPEWGLTIANSKTFVLGAWWYGVFPGVVIGVVVLNTVLLGDRLAVDGHRRG